MGLIARLRQGLHAATAPQLDDVEKALLPSGARVNEAMSETLRTMASAQQVGSTAPAVGVRPSAGAVPDASREADADPLRFQLPWGGNISYTPRSGYGTPFSILRGLAASSPVIALCIQCRKDQMASLDWDFAPRDKKTKGPEVDAKLQRARDFFAKPDGRRPHKSWIQLLVDEVLTIDAAAIYKRPTKKGAAKLAASPSARLASDEIFSYEIIDGSTIKVLLDASGDIPVPPQIAYRQIIYGSPMTGGDLTADQLMYRPKTERTWTPYGLSPIEAALLIVTADLNRSLFNLSYYSDGNIPEALAGVPDSWTPKQIRQWQEYWDLVLKGDPKNRSRLRFVVQTMAKSVHEFKKPDFTTAYDLWLLKLQCACFGVTPSEIGFTDDVNKATSKSQGDVNQRRGVKPMANFVAALHNEILIDLGLGDIETTWSGGEGEDALTQAKVQDLKLRNGTTTLDEARADDGRDPLGISDPCVVTATGPVKWDSINDPPPEPVPAPLVPAAVDATEEPDPAQAIAEDADLKKYRAVALKAVTAGKAVPAFTSAVIPAPLQARLSRALKTAHTPDDVRRIFGSVSKAQRLTSTQKKHQAAMKKKLTSLLASERAAFVEHLSAGLDA